MLSEQAEFDVYTLLGFLAQYSLPILNFIHLTLSRPKLSLAKRSNVATKGRLRSYY